MSRRSQAQIANDIQRQLAKARRDMERLVAETTGANTEPVKQASFALARNWRKVLSVPFVDGGPSAPGEAPRSRTRKLRKSIKSAVVEGVRRVGSASFRARLLEFGYAGRRSFEVAKVAVTRGNRFRRTLVAQGGPQPPRPHASVAMEQSKDQMVDVFVSEVQRRVAREHA